MATRQRQQRTRQPPRLTSPSDGDYATHYDGNAASYRDFNSDTDRNSQSNVH
jgi:hypothetical protein